MVKLISFLFLIVFGLLALFILFVAGKSDYDRKDVDLTDSIPVLIGAAIICIFLPLIVFLSSE